MRKGFVLLCLIGLLNAGSAVACDIVNKRKIHVGVSEGVAGECSNTGEPVQCVGKGEEANSLNCNGPEGSFSGSDLQDLIRTACGCGAQSDDGASDQLREELGGS